MRCIGCDRVMTTYEMSAKKSDGTYEDMCNTCLKSSLYYSVTAPEQENSSILKEIEEENNNG